MELTGDILESFIKDGHYVRGTFTFIHEYPKTSVFYEAYALLSQKMKKKSWGHSANLCATAMHKLDKFVHFRFLCTVFNGKFTKM